MGSGAEMSNAWRRVEAAQTCGDRVIPSWKIRQTQRRRNRVAWVALQAALMIGAVIVFLWSLKMLFPAVHAQSLQSNGVTATATISGAFKTPTTIEEWKRVIGWSTVTFTETAPDEIKVCVGVKPELKKGTQVCYTLGELRGSK